MTEVSQTARDFAADYHRDKLGTLAHIRLKIREGAMDSDPVVRLLARFEQSLAHSTPADQEPVAWMYRWKMDGEFVNWRYSDASNYHRRLDGYEERPLYTTPPASPDFNAGLEAAAKVAENYDFGRSICRIIASNIRALRTEPPAQEEE